MPLWRLVTSEQEAPPAGDDLACEMLEQKRQIGPWLEDQETISWRFGLISNILWLYYTPDCITLWRNITRFRCVEAKTCNNKAGHLCSKEQILTENKFYIITIQQLDSAAYHRIKLKAESSNVLICPTDIMAVLYTGAISQPANSPSELVSLLVVYVHQQSQQRHFSSHWFHRSGSLRSRTFHIQKMVYCLLQLQQI